MGTKIYFASDFHLGVDALLTSVEREKKICRWLDQIADDIKELYLVGDVFDHWFEYKRVIPKGFSRLLGKLAELRDSSVPIYFFTGNHDMWMFRYLEDEFGIPIYRSAVERTFDGKKFLIGHGDGLGPGDHGYKLIKSIFDNRICQKAYSMIHPDIGLKLMKYFSAKSRLITNDNEKLFCPEQEWLVQFAQQHHINSDIDFYIFGHRHLPINYLLGDQKARYINLGEWMYACSYGVWDGQKMEIKFYQSDFDRIYGT
ncbi:MAG: UDP-2,3-diacylglucosamine diphosphatase [Saprospiraceae bacterium]